MSKTPYNKEFLDKKITPFGLDSSDGVKLIIKLIQINTHTGCFAPFDYY